MPNCSSQWNIQGEVYEGLVYEGMVYQISYFDTPLENMGHVRIILPSERLFSALNSVYLLIKKLTMYTLC